MDKDSMKKAGVISVAVLVVLYCAIVPVLWFVLKAPAIMCLGVTVIFGLIALVTLYYARERMKEIEEGLEDAVDNY